MNRLITILVFAFQLALFANQTSCESSQFPKHSNLSIYLVTYNVAGESPSEDLLGLFDHFEGDLHDIYVVALQELPNSIILTGVDAHMKQLEEVFAKMGYSQLEKKRMTVTALYVYVRQNEFAEFSNLAKVSTAFDWKKLKGALAIRMTYRGISLAFVGAHFYAFDEKYEDRVDNYNQIIQKIHFSENHNDGILNQDLTFFLGDLNFRINDLSDADVLLHIQNQNWGQLLKHDQLNLAKSQGRAFQGFTESSINFSPTYKFTPNSDSYNLKRKPAYTDRILYRGGDSLQVISYTSLMGFRGSDHKPVRAVVKVNA